MNDVREMSQASQGLGRTVGALLLVAALLGLNALFVI
jgi:hypothetical protein